MARGKVDIPIRGVDTSGDAARKPPGTVRVLQNAHIRPGPRIEKRWGFLREGTIPVSGGNLGSFYVWDDERNGRRFLIASSADAATRTQGSYKNAAGNWAAFANAKVAAGVKDAVTAFHRIYGIYDGDSTGAGGSWSWDGTTEEVDPFLVQFEGASIEFFQGRIVLVAPTITIDNKMADADGTAYKFESATCWTDTNMAPTVPFGNVRQLVPSSATGKIVSKTLVTTTRDGSWTYRFIARPLHPTISLPLTIMIVDVGSGNSIAERPITIPSASEDPNFRSYVVVGKVRSGTALRVEVHNGNDAQAGVTSTGFVIADSTNNSAYNLTTHPTGSATSNNGHMFTEGEFVHDKTPTVAQTPLPTIYYPTRAYLSQALEPSNWTSTGWEDIVGIPGELTLVRGDGSLLFFFKSNAIFVYRGTGDTRRAIQPERDIPNFGCRSPKSFVKFEGRWYFIGENGVFEWDRSGLPRELAGPGRREDMFNSTTVTAPPIAVDEMEREVWCSTQPGRIDVFNLETSQWHTEVIENASGTALAIKDMVFVKPVGQSAPEMWLMMDATNDIVKLRKTQRKDNITGTEWDIRSRWEFLALDTEDPQQDLVLESVGFRHEITRTQNASVTRFRWSKNDGESFTDARTIDVSPLSGGGTRPLKVAIHRQAKRAVVQLEHVGEGGPDAFNSTGAWAEVNIKSGRLQLENPAANT